MDCTNLSKPNFAGLKFSGDTSGGEQVAKWAQDGFAIHQREVVNSCYSSPKELRIQCGTLFPDTIWNRSCILSRD